MCFITGCYIRKFIELIRPLFSFFFIYIFWEIIGILNVNQLLRKKTVTGDILLCRNEGIGCIGKFFARGKFFLLCIVLTVTDPKLIFLGVILIDGTGISIYKFPCTAKNIFKKNVNVLDFLKLLFYLSNQLSFHFVFVRNRFHIPYIILKQMYLYNFHRKIN